MSHDLDHFENNRSNFCIGQAGLGEQFTVYKECPSATSTFAIIRD